jgi:hypothetical protein
MAMADFQHFFDQVQQVIQRGHEQPDLTHLQNTKLTEEKEAEFQAWVKDKNREADLKDYDLRGAWQANAKEAGDGHLPDRWKKRNHPTWSTESQYDPQRLGGSWEKNSDGRWSFRASDANITNLGIDRFLEYFKTKEPDSDLVLPTLKLPYVVGDM